MNHASPPDPHLSLTPSPSPPARCLHAAPGMQLDEDEGESDDEEDEWGEEGEYIMLGAAGGDADADDDSEEEEDGWAEEEDGWDGDEVGRVAFTVSYFVDGAFTLPTTERVHDEDVDSYAHWLREVGLGVVARHAHLPLLVNGPSEP
jgi:hypothetical protein